MRLMVASGEVRIKDGAAAILVTQQSSPTVLCPALLAFDVLY